MIRMFKCLGSECSGKCSWCWSYSIQKVESFKVHPSVFKQGRNDRPWENWETRVINQTRLENVGSNNKEKYKFFNIKYLPKILNNLCIHSIQWVEVFENVINVDHVSYIMFSTDCFSIYTTWFCNIWLKNKKTSHTLYELAFTLTFKHFNMPLEKKSEVYEKEYQIFIIKNLTTMRVLQQRIKTSLKKPSKKLQTLLRKLFRKLMKLRMLKNLKRKLMLLRMKVSKLKQYLKYWDCNQ